ncbi:MAG: hypothetical protein Q7S78_01585 [Candidatus Azambacteria bacterium]|nr:hypothetical protein [Candidatus Azambacteria bacterium]
MTIYQNIIEKSTQYFIYIILILAFLIGLGTGLLVNNNKPSQIIIDKNAKIGLPVAQTDIPASMGLTGGNFMASINGAAYYPKGCPSANRIKEENIIWFGTKEEAEMQGYKPAQNCEF